MRFCCFNNGNKDGMWISTVDVVHLRHGDSHREVEVRMRKPWRVGGEGF
jgi:hypothetical protein